MHSATTAVLTARDDADAGNGDRNVGPVASLPSNHVAAVSMGLGDRTKGTLVALGLHKRNQTVYHAHAPDIAGKILAVKELVEVHNVPASAVRTKQQQRHERASPKGYKVVGTKRGAWL
ncbi:hypothetical protein BD626DRAFT_635173 [Schizophyllum amplum]|uniref:Large ribosomal subunit protein uL30-like ferredoxin-like fold domain-containing protein n=1 Tax=Schizophyllum amplum TaxID=97359 RepID=A0A550BX58_9AGAR|nr:hypothetical protein BD626DRAFT_635173 [Auriculariopsis ampla]